MAQTHPNFPQMGQTPPPMPPMRPKKKKLIWPWILLAIFVIGIIAAFLDDDKASEYKSDSATQTELTKEDVLSQLKDNAEYLDSVIPKAKRTTSPDMLLAYVRDVKTMANKVINDTAYKKFCAEPDVAPIVEENSKKAKKILPEVMTICRRQYAKQAKDKLWEENIDVQTSNGGTTITFIGGIFANNKNIKNWQEQCGSQLKELGFKRVQYKWIPHDPDYTYYDL